VTHEVNQINNLDDARQEATSDRKREKDLLATFSLVVRRLAGGVFPGLLLHSEGEPPNASQGSLKRNPTHVNFNPKASELSDMSVSKLTQAGEAFDEILFHLLIVSENFHNSVRLVTLGHDICGLLNKVKDSDKPGHLSFIKTVSETEDWLQVTSLSVAIPNSDIILVNDFSVDLKYGNTLLITGASGSGKTALLRCLFGLWPSVAGGVSRPDNDFIIVLPQKPYCSLGTLAEQVTYPKPATAYVDEHIKEALSAVCLSHLLTRYSLTSMEKWHDKLSMGELQRIGFARIHLQKPKFAFLDESSSSLDMDSERQMYELVCNIVTGGFVSIGHRKSIERYHLHKITLFGHHGKGAWRRDF